MSHRGQLFLASFFLALTPVFATAQQPDTARVRLRGLAALCVDFSTMDETTGEYPASLYADTASLRRDIELPLRQAGLRVLDSPESSPNTGLPCLRPSIIITRNSPSEGFVYMVFLQLVEDLRLVRAPTLKVRAPTWQASVAAGRAQPSALSDQLRAAVRDVTDQFLNAFLATNPRRGPR